MACGLQLGLFLLLCRSYRDAVIHTGLGSRLCKVFIQLNLQAVTKPKSIKNVPLTSFTSMDSNQDFANTHSNYCSSY